MTKEQAQTEVVSKEQLEQVTGGIKPGDAGGGPIQSDQVKDRLEDWLDAF